MLHGGLVSITFRELSPEEVIDLVGRAGLEGIEWGGDVHVPHGNLGVARRVRELTEEAGLVSRAYGSYYVAGEPGPVSFDTVAATAEALGAPNIRIWAGSKASDCEDEHRRRVVEDTRRVADLAARREKTVAFEYHPNTLTDTPDSARRLMEEIDHPAVRCYWQPPPYASRELCLEGIGAVSPWLGDVHCFHWDRQTRARLPLEEGSDDWRAYLSAIDLDPRDHFVMLEFVQEDSPENFLRDAQTLRRWLGVA